MQLPPEEPYFGPWQVAPVQAFVRLLEETLPKTGGLKVIAVDGRSAGGKTTLASLLGRAIAGSAIVHTDDLPSSGNWSGTDLYSSCSSDARSFFDWTERLLKNVLKPARAGFAVKYRPDAWEDWSREKGAIEIPSGCPLLILEGVGAARRELTHALDAAIWVQSDVDKAKTRGVARDGGDAAARTFWDEWMTQEFPFVADQKPWERADFIVTGTPELEHDSSSEIVFAVPT